MITLTINGESYPFQDITPDWINQRIHQHQANHQPFCVKILIRQNGLDMILATSGCPVSGGASPRQPNPREQELFDLWRKFDLNDMHFTGGNLVVFLAHLRHALG